MRCNTLVLLGVATLTSIVAAADINADLELNPGKDGKHHKHNNGGHVDLLHGLDGRVNLTLNFEHEACYKNGPSGRALSAEVLIDNNLTIEKCGKHCHEVRGGPWDYFGLEYGRECYCGNNLNVGASITSHTDCNTPCSGDKHKKCGGENRIDVYLILGEKKHHEEEHGTQTKPGHSASQSGQYKPSATQKPSSSQKSESSPKPEQTSKSSSSSQSSSSSKSSSSHKSYQSQAPDNQHSGHTSSSNHHHEAHHPENYKSPPHHHHDDHHGASKLSSSHASSSSHKPQASHAPDNQHSGHTSSEHHHHEDHHPENYKSPPHHHHDDHHGSNKHSKQSGINVDANVGGHQPGGHKTQVDSHNILDVNARVTDPKHGSNKSKDAKNNGLDVDASVGDPKHGGNKPKPASHNGLDIDANVGDHGHSSGHGGQDKGHNGLDIDGSVGLGGPRHGSGHGQQGQGHPGGPQGQGHNLDLGDKGPATGHNGHGGQGPKYGKSGSKHNGLDVGGNVGGHNHGADGGHSLTAHVNEDHHPKLHTPDHQRPEHHNSEQHSSHHSVDLLHPLRNGDFEDKPSEHSAWKIQRPNIGVAIDLHYGSNGHKDSPISGGSQAMISISPHAIHAEGHFYQRIKIHKHTKYSFTGYTRHINVKDNYCNVSFYIDGPNADEWKHDTLISQSSRSQKTTDWVKVLCTGPPREGRTFFIDALDFSNDYEDKQN